MQRVKRFGNEKFQLFNNTLSGKFLREAILKRFHDKKEKKEEKKGKNRGRKNSRESTLNPISQRGKINFTRRLKDTLLRGTG